jgi:DNA-binding MarR family transcriptional regulator
VAGRGNTSARRSWSSNPEDPARRQVYLLLQHVSGKLVHELGIVTRTARITPEQYQVLRILNGAGSGGLPLSLIAERSPAGDPDITRLVDRLEKHGLVKRERDTIDRRVITARITSEGRRVHSRLEKAVAALHDRQLAILGRQGLGDLKKLLEKVADADPVT